jgi:hypothetical protein
MLHADPGSDLAFAVFNLYRAAVDLIDQVLDTGNLALR